MSPDPSTSLAPALNAFDAGDLEAARAHAEAYLARHPSDEEAEALLDDIAMAMAMREAPEAPQGVAAGSATDQLSPSASPRSDPFADAASEARSKTFGDLRAWDERPRRTRVHARTSRKRIAAPTGVRLLAGFQLLGAALTGILGVVVLFGIGSSRGPDGESVVVALALLGLAWIGYVLARGLYRLREWAWWVAVILEVFTFVISLVSVFESPVAILRLMISVVVIPYLIAVRHVFTGHACACATRASDEESYHYRSSGRVQGPRV